MVRTSRCLILALLTMASSSFPSTARTQDGGTGPVGDDLALSVTLPGFPLWTVVDTNESGDFIVSWVQGFDGPPVDPEDGSDSYARVFGSNGAPSSDTFGISEDSRWDQIELDVGIDQAGRSVVLWISRRGMIAGEELWTGEEPGEDNNGLYLRRFDSTGTALSGDVSLSAQAPRYEFANGPTVQMEETGRFVVAWMMSLPGGLIELSIQLFNSSGEPLGDPFPATKPLTIHTRAPKLALLPDGGFVLAWSDERGISIRFFDPDGQPTSEEILAAIGIDDFSFSRLEIAASDTGDLLLVWQRLSIESNRYDIYARHFDASTSSFGPVQRLNTQTAGDQSDPAVASGLGGEFLVVWTQRSLDYFDSDFFTRPDDIFARVVHADGRPGDAEQRVNHHEPGRQAYPDVACDGFGRYLVVWSGQGQEPAPGMFGVHGRFFETPNTISRPDEGGSASVSSTNELVFWLALLCVPLFGFNRLQRQNFRL